MRHLPLLFLVWISAARCDVFLLADGSRCEGTAVESGDQLVISTFDGRTLNVAKKDLRGSVTEPRRNTYFSRLKALKADDAAGRVELAKFCEANKFTSDAENLYRAALKIDPANADAGRALGYELHAGKWEPKPEEFTIAVRPAPDAPKTSPGKALAPVRPPPPLPELPKDPQQAMRVRLSRIPVDAALPLAPSLGELIADAQKTPAYVSKLLIPPQFPGSLPNIPPDVRRRAAWLAGLSQDRRVMDALVTASVYDPDEYVRFAAAKALPLLEEPVSIRKLMDIALSGDNRKYPWPVRKVASIALRRYGSQEVIERLMKELSFELAGGNPIDPKNSLRGKGSGLGSDNPILMQDNQMAYGVPDTDLYPVLSATKEITGVSFDKHEKDMKTWIAWWKTDGAHFEFKD